MVMVAIPTSHTAHMETFKSLWGLRGQAGFAYVRGHDTGISRNKLARLAIDGGYDHILYVDADMVIPENALELMMQGDADVVAALYPKRSDHSVANVYMESPGSGLPYEKVDGLPDRVPISFCGFGCVLVRTELLRRMEYPWFQFCEYPNGDFLSEDFFFCQEAMRAGAVMEADTRVRCGHILEEVYT